MWQDMSDIVRFFSTINEDPEKGGSKFDSIHGLVSTRLFYKLLV